MQCLHQFLLHPDLADQAVDRAVDRRGHDHAGCAPADCWACTSSLKIVSILAARSPRRKLTRVDKKNCAMVQNESPLRTFLEATMNGHIRNGAALLLALALFFPSMAESQVLGGNSTVFASAASPLVRVPMTKWTIPTQGGPTCSTSCPGLGNFSLSCSVGQNCDCSCTSQPVCQCR